MVRTHNYQTSLIVSSVLVFLSGCSEKIDSVEEYVMVAQVHERNGKYADAVKAYSEALKLSSGSGRALLWYDRGVAQGRLNHLEDALADYDKAIELNPELAVAFNNRAAIHAQLGNYQAAVDDCTRALALDPADAMAYRNRGLARHDMDQFVEAISDYDRAIDLNGQDARSFLYRANVLLDLSRLRLAADDVDRALVLDPTLATAWLSRAIVSARLGELPRAEQELAKAGKLGADTSDTDLSALSREASGAVEVVVREHLAALGYAAGSQPKTVKQADRLFEVVIRVAEADGRVLFSADELDELSALKRPGILVVIGEDGQVVKTRPHFRPDRSAMTPTTFALDVSEQAEPAEDVEAAPAIPLAEGE